MATYMSDKSHYAYLSSGGCGKDGILDVADVDPILEETVRKFYDAGDRRCAEKGMPYVCVMEARIDADMAIIRGQDGEFAVKLMKIHEYFFASPRD